MCTLWEHGRGKKWRYERRCDWDFSTWASVGSRQSCRTQADKHERRCTAHTKEGGTDEGWLAVHHVTSVGVGESSWVGDCKWRRGESQWLGQTHMMRWYEFSIPSGKSHGRELEEQRHPGLGWAARDLGTCCVFVWQRHRHGFDGRLFSIGTRGR